MNDEIRFDTAYYLRDLMLKKLRAQSGYPISNKKGSKYLRKFRNIFPVRTGIKYDMYVGHGGDKGWKSMFLTDEQIMNIYNDLASE